MVNIGVFTSPLFAVHFFDYGIWCYFASVTVKAGAHPYPCMCLSVLGTH